MKKTTLNVLSNSPCQMKKRFLMLNWYMVLTRLRRQLDGFKKTVKERNMELLKKLQMFLIDTIGKIIKIAYKNHLFTYFSFAL